MIKKINKPKELPKLAIKFANMVFVLGFLFCVLTVVYASYRIFNPIYDAYLGNKEIETFYITSMLCGGVFAVLFGLGLKRLGNDLKVNLSLLFFTVGIAVYGFETYLEFHINPSYDTRVKTEVLDDLRDSGFEAFPNFLPYIFLESNGLTAKKGGIYPLGTISNSTTIFSNVPGYYPIIETDEHGFNNPKGLYNKNKVDILLTGGSHTEGYSVNSNESIGAVLRQFDFNAISIGKGYNGPLIELAALKEYAEPLEPKIVLWLYSTNDLPSLSQEMASSILKKYLNEDDYSQNLISRQKEVDNVLKNYVPVWWKKEIENERKAGEKNKFSNSPVVKISKLYNLRKSINLTPTPVLTLSITSSPTPIFRDILKKSRQMVLGWGGKMYFIYLADFAIFNSSEHPDRDFVMQTVTELGIPIIDIQSKVFDLHPDPLSLFPHRMLNHYNAKGYRLVAEVIGKRLEADGYVPIKSKK